MSTEPDVKDWFYKTVPFEWRSRRFNLALSHSVFSSDRVDEGSRRLLSVLDELLEHYPPPTSGGRVYDIGCGVGVLGIVAGAGVGACEVILEDRDALAVTLAGENAKRNSLGDRVRLEARPTGVTRESRCELVLCNLPAKAGEQVHDLMLSHAFRHISDGGLYLVVVVNTIAARVERTITDLKQRFGGEEFRTVAHEEYRGHTVFAVYRNTAQAAVSENSGEEIQRHEPPQERRGRPPEERRGRPPEERRGRPPEEHRVRVPELTRLPDSYIGTRKRFANGNFHYDMTTIEGLGEYDGPSFTTRMLTRLAAERCRDRKVLLLEVGPGHLPAALQSLPPARQPVSVRIAARNTLAGIAAVEINGGIKTEAPFLPCERPYRLTEYLDPGGLVVLPVAPEPYTPALEELFRFFERARAFDTEVVIAGRAGVISSVEKRKQLPLIIHRRARSRGIRGLVLGPRGDGH